MRRILIATNNRGKLHEFATHFREWEVVCPADVGVRVDVEEDGKTYEENALKKARALCAATGLPAIADDSGLEVEALGGEPGVFTARYAFLGATDEQNNALILKKLAGKPKPYAAKAVCALAFVTAEGKELVVRGECEGEFIEDARGDEGFGFDKHFYYHPLGCTFAQLTTERKNRVSHRAVAIRALTREIEKQGGDAYEREIDG